jgi:four helix bundle protein
MGDFAEEFKDRTKKFALRVIRVVGSLPDQKTPQTLGHQLLRSGTAVGANYRAACRARSPAEFCSKLGIVEEKCDETIYWLELLAESELVAATRLVDLMTEANEILAIVIASIKTSKHSP